MHDHDYRADIQARILPFIQRLALDQGKVRKGVLDELAGLLAACGIARDTATLSRAFRGRGKSFAENFTDPNIRSLITVYLGLQDNKDFVVQCEALRLPLPSRAKFEAWKTLNEKASDLANRRYADNRWNKGRRESLLEAMRAAIFELVLCYKNAVSDVDQAVREAEGIIRKMSTE